MTKNQKRQLEKRSTNYFLLPIAIVLIIIPLVIREFIFSPSITKEAWFPNANIASDYFLFYKGIILIGIGLLMGAILLYRQICSQQKPFAKFQTWQFCLLIYAVFVLLSTFTSSYRSICFNGTYEQFETTLVLLTYCLLTWYAYSVVDTEKDIKILLRYLYYGIAMMTGVGLLQLIGADPITTDFGKYIIAADKSKEAIDAMRFNFEKNRVYMTLLNPNYVGVYAALLFPITMGLTILLKKPYARIISALGSLLLVVSVFGSQSKTGLIVIGITSIILIVVLRNRIFSNKRVFITLVSLFAIILVGFFVINAIQGNTYLTSIKNAFSTNKDLKSLEEIETRGDYIHILYNGKVVQLRCELDEEGKVDFSVTDSEGTPYKVRYDDSTMTFTLADEVFNSLSVTPIFLNQDGVFGCEVMIDNKPWYFKSRTDSEGYGYMNKYGRFDQIKTADAMLFEDYEQVFTGRGYLWSRTLPLLKDYILVGLGPSTFVYAFPQDDYVGKYNNGFDSQVVTKPHNLYLQMAIETGLVSCITFIILCILYILQCVRVYRKSQLHRLVEQMGVLICVGVIGYMISGIINDSNVGVAPIFWVLLGVGFACNRIVCSEEARKKKIEAMEV